MHGILDTSMGWVSNGVTGSQAFAAFDQGFDVWLGNSRANPPREHERKQSYLHKSGLPVALHINFQYCKRLRTYVHLQCMTLQKVFACFSLQALFS